MELSKSNKKAARELIEKALQKDFEKALSESESLLQNWRQEKQNNRDTYYTLYKHIDKFDKYIAQRYDDVRGSTYLPTVIGLLMDKVIDASELSCFSEDVQIYIVKVAKSLS